MNREALFCDGTANYVSPAEPMANEKVSLRFRTAANDVEHVFLLDIVLSDKRLKKDKSLIALAELIHQAIVDEKYMIHYGV